MKGLLNRESREYRGFLETWEGGPKIKNAAHDFAPHRTDSPDIPEINPDNLDSKVIVKENFQ